MMIEVELTAAEMALLQQILTDNADEFIQSWDVVSLPDLVHLLALHGADHLADLVGTQCQGGEVTVL